MRTMMRRRGAGIKIAAILSGAFLAGCGPPVNREQLIKQVLDADPGFSSVLARHRELARRIDTYQRELALKRNTVEQSIRQMRKELAEKAIAVKSKVDETKRGIGPDRKRLELALFMAAEEMKAKHVQRASLGHAIARLRKSRKSGDIPASTAERIAQESQLNDLVNDAARLDQEIVALNTHIHFIKVKLFLIKL